MTISSSKSLDANALQSSQSSEEFKENNNFLKNSNNMKKNNDSYFYEKTKLAANFDSIERQEKIKDIKSRILSGVYYVNPSDVATSMLKDLLKEIR